MNASKHTPEHTLIVLDANSYWTEQLFSSCAPAYRVLLMKPRDIRAHFLRHGRLRGDRRPRNVRDGVYEQRLGFFPGWMFERWRYLERRLARAMKRFVCGDPPVFAFNYPQYRTILKHLPHRLSLYYNTDEYANHWPGREHLVAQWEREAVDTADVTVCIAAHRCRRLKERYPHRADRIHYLPIGCTPRFMVGEPLREPKSLVGGLSSLQRPVVGYVGALNWRFDFEFLDRVAGRLPSVTFALGGKAPTPSDGSHAWWSAFEACRRRRNVHFFGPVRHEEVGRCLQSFDVLMMMYTDTPVNHGACPAKLWDYLGTSLPIVANEVVPEVTRWRDAVYCRSTPAAFADGVETALKEDRPSRGARRLAIAAEHTWSRLGERMLGIIDHYLSARP